MTILVISLLAGSALFSYLLNQILYKFTRNLGVHGQSSDGTIIRWGSTSKPTIGGISFFITFILSALVFFLIREGAHDISHQFLGLISVVTLGFLIGLQDDAYNTKPLLKFLGQLGCGVIMIVFGVYINLTGITAIDYGLTLFWTVGIMNSINLLDNMDGVTATISLMILGTTVTVMCLYPLNATDDPYFFTLLATSGSFIGFLILNWHPSKIYMGDTGSQFIGALLAFVGVKFFWNIQSMNTNVVTTMQIITPVMVFLVPIMDTSFVTIARIMRGQSPFVGGKDHLTHHIYYLGVPERWVPAALGLLSLLSGLVTIFTVRYVFQWNHAYTALFSGYIVISVGIFFFLYKKGEKVSAIRERLRRMNSHAGEITTGPQQVTEKEKLSS